MLLVQFVSIILLGHMLCSQAEWVKEKILGYEVIEEKCLSRGAPPLQDLLPDIEFFNSIATAVMEYRSPIVINAGRGTTGTRELTAIFQTHGWSTIHFSMGVCRNPQVTRCFHRHLETLLHEVSHKNMAPSRYMNADKGRKLTASFLAKILSCGDCGPLLIGDSPWVNIFTELYLAVCAHAMYDAKVIYSRRDPSAWSLSRSQHHKGCRTCFLCSSSSVLDPFSYTQCSAKGLNDTNIFMSLEQDILDGITNKANDTATHSKAEHSMGRLTSAYVRYSQHVRALVKDDLRLEVNVFHDTVMPEGPKLNFTSERARQVWDEDISRLVLHFAGRRHRS